MKIACVEQEICHLLENIGLLLYALLILNSSQYLFKFKKNVANMAGLVLPGLHCFGQGTNSPSNNNIKLT